MGRVDKQREAYLTCLMLMLMLLSILQSAILSVSTEAYYSETSVLIGSIYVVEISSKSTGTLHVVFPKYVVANKAYTINVTFERTLCFSQPTVSILEVIGVVKTAEGTRQFVIGTFSVSFTCKDRNVQHRNFVMIIPKSIYDMSVDKHLTLYLKCKVNCILEDQVPAKITLVNGVPEPRITINNLNEGYISINKGESKSIAISVSALNAPLLITNVKVSEPSFISSSLETPLPLVINPSSQIPIMLIVHGMKPGVGIITVRIYYNIGAQTKYIPIFIPVMVEEDKITSLLNQYRESIKNYYQQLSELESTLHMKINTVQKSSEALQQIITELNKVISAHVNTADDIKQLKTKYNSLLDDLKSIQKTLSNLVVMMHNMNQTINYLSDKQGIISRKIPELSKNISSIQNEVNKLNITSQVLTVVFAIIALVVLTLVVKRIR